MSAFRALLVLIFLVVAGYTAVVVPDHGVNLFPAFFGDIGKMGWPGQFNVDFMCFLILSALWVSWRHGFSLLGLAFGVAAFFGGALFFCVYLLVASFLVNGNSRALLLGEARATG